MPRELQLLAPLLERALQALPSARALPDDEARALRQRVIDRIRRDLLPRLSADHPFLLVAIAGPNNVGKSSLFNALVAQNLSPARAEGGLTKQCLGAAHPSLWTPEMRELVARKFEVIEVAEGTRPPVDQPGPPGRLYLLVSGGLPRHLLLLDTPDFDSVYRDNRANTEALLVTVDVLLFVVSRHTYQNAALVDFLRTAVGEGRPYLLVYNEAVREQTAREHLEKLAADVGRPPLAMYAAAHQPEVEAGNAFLQTTPIARSAPLQELLETPAHAEELKRLALAASVRDTSGELVTLASLAERAAAEPDRLRKRLRHELLAVGQRAALKAVPADVLVRALRDELDARSAVHKWVRLPFRGLATALGYVGKAVRRAFTTPEEDRPTARDLQDAALKDGVRRVLEALAPEAAAYRGDPEVKTLLADALGPSTASALEAPLSLEGDTSPQQDQASLYAFCRRLVGDALQGGFQQEVLQALTTLVYSVPAGAAALVTVATGGFGHDAVIWAGTLLSAPLLEKFVDLLGANIRHEVTQRWSEEHGATLANALERRFFAPLLDVLDAQADALRTAGTELRELASSISEGER